MDVQERIRMILLQEEIKKNKETSKELGLVDKSEVLATDRRTKGGQ